MHAAAERLRLAPRGAAGASGRVSPGGGATTHWAFWPESGRRSSAIPGLAVTWRSCPQPAGRAEEERGPPAGICHPGSLAGALTPPEAAAVCVPGPIPLGLDLRARRHKDRALISTHRFAPGLGTQTECSTVNVTLVGVRAAPPPPLRPSGKLGNFFRTEPDRLPLRLRLKQ
ncbi:hypothetical protein NDU88_006276 [Pleurodeles waltl]|uniref:Uncharacterized protein n=1 Tax=Pleurodeles waltl TaxID=8319 RepID=A0AAV7NQA0_PLEWA|nr:hypothetical protein NDU88_006276 [Pleurodeles waltl]